jgi:hypothetical protein
MSGELLTSWTIRLALLCYAAYLAGWLIVSASGNRARPWSTVAHWLWTLGCVAFVAHVGCAFHFYHDWSHAAAFEKTAAETEQLLGVRFGEGIYFSYVFLVLWVLDVIGLWAWPLWKWQGSSPTQPRPLVAAMQWILHAYLFFIAFNGAIIFEAGPTRWVGVGACLLLGGLGVRAAYNSQCGLRNAECKPSKQPPISAP